MVPGTDCNVSPTINVRFTGNSIMNPNNQTGIFLRLRWFKCSLFISDSGLDFCHPCIFSSKQNTRKKCESIIPLGPGGVPADISRHLRRAAEDLHGARGGRLRARDPGQPAHHGSGGVPSGGREAAVHRQDGGEPAVHQPGWAEPLTAAPPCPRGRGSLTESDPNDYFIKRFSRGIDWIIERFCFWKMYFVVFNGSVPL